MTKSIRLYTYTMSPFASKVHCFLLYKQLDFECFYINPLKVKRDLPVGRQIPVLTIGDESRADSTPIGNWLDERFPEAPRLLPEDGPARDKAIALDHWVTERLIPCSFRSYPGEGIDRLLGAWRLASVMHRTARGGLPLALRAAWPLVIGTIPFVKAQVAMTDRHLPVREAKFAIYREFVEKLEGGPFLGGSDAPAMADLSAYPQFALFWTTGFRGGEDIAEVPEVMQWLERMRPIASRTPTLIPEQARTRPLP